jgi:O-succinylbenzoate synthase
MLADVFPDLSIVQLPMRNRFRGITVREIAIFNGPYGWSEFGPFLEYSDQESVPWLKAAWEAANQPWPTQYRDRVAINATLPIVAPDQVSGILARFPGCMTVKIKVNDFSSAADVIEEVLDINADYRIRLDVNADWDLATAVDNLLQFHRRFGDVFEYVEQPCESLDDLAIVKQEAPIPVAVDESIRKNLAKDFTDMKRFADIAIIKWQPLGGFRAARAIADTIDLPVVISSALETGIGIAHGAALAASFSDSNFACGLGTVALFEEDICLPSAMPVDGYLDVQRREPVNHQKYLADKERTLWWHERMVRIWSLIQRSEDLLSQPAKGVDE